jgi:hypothetical protein
MPWADGGNPWVAALGEQGPRVVGSAYDVAFGALAAQQARNLWMALQYHVDRCGSWLERDMLVALLLVAGDRYLSARLTNGEVTAGVQARHGSQLVISPQAPAAGYCLDFELLLTGMFGGHEDEELIPLPEVRAALECDWHARTPEQARRDRRRDRVLQREG